MENGDLRSKVDYFNQLVPSLVAKEELEKLLVENSHLKEQRATLEMENSALSGDIQKMKLNESALVEQLGKSMKIRIPCSICKKLCNSEKSLQRHITDKHMRDNDF